MQSVQSSGAPRPLQNGSRAGMAPYRETERPGSLRQACPVAWNIVPVSESVSSLLKHVLSGPEAEPQLSPFQAPWREPKRPPPEAREGCPRPAALPRGPGDCWTSELTRSLLSTWANASPSRAWPGCFLGSFRTEVRWAVVSGLLWLVPDVAMTLSPSKELEPSPRTGFNASVLFHKTQCHPPLVAVKKKNHIKGWRKSFWKIQ